MSQSRRHGRKSQSRFLATVTYLFKGLKVARDLL